MTESAEYAFRVVDEIPGRDKAWVSAEPVRESLPTLGSKSIGFLLRIVTQEEAEKVADFLNDHIAQITIW